MRRFFKKHVMLFVAIVLMLLALQFSVKERSNFFPVKQIIWGVSGITLPLLSFMSNSVDTLKNVFSDYVLLVDVAKENRELKEQIGRLREETHLVEELRSENKRLRTLLGYTESIRNPGTASRVVSYDLTPWSNAFFIDAGKNRGIEKGMAVIVPEGIAGRVYRVYPTASMVVSIKDHRFTIDARLQRTRVRCIVRGTGSGCRLKYVRTTDDILEGDSIISSGFGRFFPEGVPAGVVSKIREEKGSIFRKVEMIPYVDLRKIETVYVVKSTVMEDQSGKKK